MRQERLSFTDAMREYLPVVLFLVLADTMVAGLVVSDAELPPSVSTFLVWLGCVAVLWTITGLFWLAFAAKHLWWVRRRVREEAEKLAAKADEQPVAAPPSPPTGGSREGNRHG